MLDVFMGSVHLRKVSSHKDIRQCNPHILLRDDSFRFCGFHFVERKSLLRENLHYVEKCRP